MSMREQIARALCVATGHDPDQLLTASNGIEWDGKLLWNAFLRETDAALDILLANDAYPDGNMAMGVAGGDMLKQLATTSNYDLVAIAVFKAMIQAAKDGK